jgi:hypothetical protein
MIECRLKLVPKNRYVDADSPLKKHGHYMSCFYSIKGYGQSCWVIGAYLSVDVNRYLQEGLSAEEIATRCIEYLNHRPKSRYGKKRKRKPLYGEFRPEPHLVKLLGESDNKYIQVLLVTKDRKNPKFWGEGVKGEYGCRRKKRKK